MSLPSRLNATVICLSVIFASVPLPLAAAGATILIEQESPIEAVGTWTLSNPNQEVTEGSGVTVNLVDSLIGRHTLFVTSPEGTLATIEYYIDGELQETLLQPQLSFTTEEGKTHWIRISYRLENHGIVGVNSQPSGIPFTLSGPNSMRRSGVTPMNYLDMPVGNYSVQYKPAGCVFPPGKSDILEKDKSVYFSLELQCSTFRPEEKEGIETHISTDINGKTVTFTDVPHNSWFAPFVATVSDRDIITGYKDAQGNSTGLFGPGNLVTAAELVKIMHKMKDLDENDFTQPPRNQGALGKWFTKFIASAEERGWFIYQDPNADLLRTVTRGEVVMTALQVLDVPLQWAKGDMFTDVLRRTPYAHAVETAAVEGFVSGATDDAGKPTGFFYPDQAITRAEMAKIVINIHEKYIKRKFIEE